MKTLFVTDLDGTLLNSGSKLSDFTVKTLNNLIENGMCFSYATARSSVSAKVVTSGLTTAIPVIVYNGTFIINLDTNEKLYELYFSEHQKNTIHATLEKYSINPLVYKYINGEEKVSWINGKENEGIIDLLNKRTGDKRYISVKNSGQLYCGNIFYYTCIGTKAELSDMYHELEKNSELTCILQPELYRPEYWLQIMPKNATKGNAIIKLKQLLGCDKIVSFGDAINDLPMFKLSDESYAVENAVKELKNCSTGIIKSNDDDGVAHWLIENYNKLSSSIQCFDETSF